VPGTFFRGIGAESPVFGAAGIGEGAKNAPKKTEKSLLFLWRTGVDRLNLAMKYVIVC
jgi:hypothetical protein